MPHTVFDLTAKDFEKPHIANKVQPAPMEEHCGQEGEVAYQGQMMTMASGIFDRNNSKIICELLKDAPRESSLEQENNTTQENEHPCG